MSSADLLSSECLPSAAHLPAAYGATQDLEVRRKEVVLTKEQAQQLKLQKGYALEPVLPGAKTAEEELPDKRERKKSNHFGYSPPPDGIARQRESSGNVGRPRAPKPPPQLNGTPLRAAPVAAPPPPPVMMANSPYSEKRRVLQERLKRLNSQLKKLDMQAQAAVEAAAPTPFPVPPLRPQPSTPSLAYTPPSRFVPRMAQGAKGPGNGGEKRKADAEGGSSRKKQKNSNSEALVNHGKMRNLYQHCEKLLDVLMKDKASIAYFNMPVDPVAMGIPHYCQIIAYPMDLGTIKKRLENEYYQNLDMWVADVQLVWNNAIHFNPSGNDVHECAKALAAMFDKRVKQLPKPPGMDRSHSSSSLVNGADLSGVVSLSGGEGDKRKLIEMMRKVEKMERDIERVKGGKSTPTSSAAPKKKSGGGGGGGGGAANRKMTFEEKRQLSLNINKLDEDKLGRVVDIIKKRKSNMVQNSEEIEIDIDKLDMVTLRELDKYVNECLHPPAAKKQPGGHVSLQHAAQKAVGGVRPTPPVQSSDSESSEDSSDEDDFEEPSAPKSHHAQQSTPSAASARAPPTPKPTPPAAAEKSALAPAPAPPAPKVQPPASRPVVQSPAEEPAEPAEKPTILPTNAAKKAVLIENTKAWASLANDDDDGAGDGGGGGGTSGTLWSQFQEKDILNKQREEEIKREREREEERRIEEERRQKEEVENQARLRAEKELLDQQQAEVAAEEERNHREALREREKQEREHMQQTVNMDSDRMIAKGLTSGKYMGLETMQLNMADLRNNDSDSDDSDDSK